MPYYVVYAKGKTHLVDTWSECKALTHRVPNAKYKKTHTIEEAEEYIYKITNEINALEKTGYEENLAVVPSFINIRNNPKNNGYVSEVFITSISKQDTRAIQCPLTEKWILPVPKTYVGVGLSLSINEDIKPMEGFYLDYISTTALKNKGKVISKIVYDKADINNNSISLMLKELTEVISSLIEYGIKNIYLTTDSNYILYILKDNIFHDINMAITNCELKNKNEIKELYSTIDGLESLYCTKQTIGTGSMYLENINQSLINYLSDMEGNNEKGEGTKKD